MNFIKSVFIVFVLLHSIAGFTQENLIKWWNPAESTEPVIEGKGWNNNEISAFARLPEKAKNTVREEVWSLAQNSAGLSIRFRSNSSQILVRYLVKGKLSMYHMPITGVSGLDLYAKDCDGNWLWSKGNYSFNDTIISNFSPISIKESYHNLGREYRLFLPLYNSVEWLEIGVLADSRFEILPLRVEKPIVVYGTSIAQGGCASRPGMAWTSILTRKMDRPVINLGFSGNGRFESEVIGLINEIDAKLYILDCLPNMTPGSGLTPEETYSRIIESVLQLKEKHPETPVLLVEHAGYSDGTLNNDRLISYTELNNILKNVYQDLLQKGIGQLYYLTKEDLNLDINSFVDGTHPNDQGMLQYAKGYEEKIRNIFYEPSGQYSTTIPVTQLRELPNYDWEKRHREIIEINNQNPPDICFLGNSIVHFWGGKPAGPIQRGAESWNSLFLESNARNFAFGWDRIENVLWRVTHDELDGFDAKQILLKIGTNNLQINTDEEIITGIDQLIKVIKQRQPKSNVLVFGILPRRNQEERIKKLNFFIAQVAAFNNVKYTNIGDVLLLENGKIEESLFTDGLHPNEKGYQKISAEIKPHLIKQ